jgi:Methyltransferase domain
MHHNNFHRKQWEFAAIAQALFERDKLDLGYKGLGFAVGREPLVSSFASFGADIEATDIGPSSIADHWAKAGQYADSLASLYDEKIIPRHTFDEKVRFYNADMRDLTGFKRDYYDFIWSSCALEHLGTLEAGLSFILDSADLLKAGGIAVHTTEFNVSSLTDTVTEGQDVLYRRSDIESLDARLRAKGACLEKTDFWAGSHEFDRLFDYPPYYENGRKHVKLQSCGFVCTSILLIVYR